jgi:hypothetical protein
MVGFFKIVIAKFDLLQQMGETKEAFDFKRDGTIKREFERWRLEKELPWLLLKADSCPLSLTKFRSTLFGMVNGPYTCGRRGDGGLYLVSNLKLT